MDSPHHRITWEDNRLRQPWCQETFCNRWQIGFKMAWTDRATIHIWWLHNNPFSHVEWPSLSDRVAQFQDLSRPFRRNVLAPHPSASNTAFVDPSRWRYCLQTAVNVLGLYLYTLLPSIFCCSPLLLFSSGEMQMERMAREASASGAFLPLPTPCCRRTHANEDE